MSFLLIDDGLRRSFRIKTHTNFVDQPVKLLSKTSNAFVVLCLIFGIVGCGANVETESQNGNALSSREQNAEALETMEARLALIQQRLGLTDEEAKQIEPIIVEGVTQQAEILRTQLGKLTNPLDRNSLIILRGLQGKLAPIRREMNQQLEESNVMDEEQLEEYKKIQSELQSETLRRLRANLGV